MPSWLRRPTSPRRSDVSAFDFRVNAIHRGGPDNEAAVAVVAEQLHANELAHSHGFEAQPCPDCWLRAGTAIQALREAGFHLVAQIGEVQ